MRPSLLRAKYRDMMDEVNFHRFRYYVKDDPIISDFEYDVLEKKLKRFEEENPLLAWDQSPTQRPGSSLEEDYPERVKNWLDGKSKNANANGLRIQQAALEQQEKGAGENLAGSVGRQ